MTFFFFTSYDLLGILNYILSHSKIQDKVGRSETINIIPSLPLIAVFYFFNWISLQ